MGGEENHRGLLGRLPTFVGCLVLLAALVGLAVNGCGGSNDSGESDAAEIGASESASSTQESTTATPQSPPSAPAETTTAAGGKSSPKPVAGKNKSGPPFYQIELLESKFPVWQRLGNAKLLKLGWRNYGETTVPNLAVTFSTTRGQSSIEGKERDSPAPAFSTLKGGPVWKLLPGFPRPAGGSESDVIGSLTPDGKTFTFGPLAPGEAKHIVWKVRAVHTGTYTLKYGATGDLSEKSITESPFGVPPGAWFSARISED